MEMPCLKFMNPKKKSPSFNWAGSLTNWVVFYLIKKLQVNKAQARAKKHPEKEKIIRVRVGQIKNVEKTCIFLTEKS